jgi:protease-4
MFSGLIWTGEEGIKLGLADELGDERHVAEHVIQAKKIVNFTPEANLLDRISRRFGAAVGDALANALTSTVSPN